MSISAGSKWFVILLLAVGVTIAALFLWVRWQSTSITSFYSVTDSLVDPAGQQIAAVYFVKVDAYDTAKIVRVGAALAEEINSDARFKQDRERSLLMYFYEEQDTAALSDVMVDELSYTNPEVPDPRAKLIAVKNGYIMQAQFAPSATSPREDPQLLQRLFYMPRPGVRASDIR